MMYGGWGILRIFKNDIYKKILLITYRKLEEKAIYDFIYRRTAQNLQHLWLYLHFDVNKDEL